MKDNLRIDVTPYEEKAKNCASCDTPGSCCLDEHFVNVRISRLEAKAIAQVIERLPPIRRAAVEERVQNAEIRNGTYACPLYEKGTGCLVHHEAKPVPCIVHACYEKGEDLPPNELQDDAELAIGRLCKQVYGRLSGIEPLPLAIQAAVSHREIT